MSISKEKKEQKQLILTKLEQYNFYRNIAFSTDPSVPWNVKVNAFEHLCDLCGQQSEKTQKWILRMEYS